MSDTLAAGEAAKDAFGDVFPHLLKSWRQKRRLSQLDLALTAGVSQRHVSFLESGRAKPSRRMILQLSECLEVPLRDRNQWLTAAGFAPVFKTRPLDDPQMSLVMSAIEKILENHEPYPAVVLDRAWNIRMANAAFELMTSLFGDDLWTRLDEGNGSGGQARNLMRLFFHPEGIRPFVTNWSIAAPLLWHRAEREAEAVGGEDMKRELQALAALQDPDTLRPPDNAGLLPVLPLEVEMNGLKVSLFTVISTFGTAQDVTADELRIEQLFPADEATAQLFESMAGAE